ncbi:MAG TPA: hypothetical protein VK896_14220 [Gaiellaceae bacterium]|nr:hypothetical protein [Gaiellaceae bacterium]
MSDEGTRGTVYELDGPGIRLTYRRRADKLDLAGDDHLLTQDDLDAVATVEPDVGLRVTATLLESSRNGTRVMLTLLLPEVSWRSEGSQEPEEVSGVAVVTSSFTNAVGGAPPVLQRHDDVRRLEGTASPAA